MKSGGADSRGKDDCHTTVPEKANFLTLLISLTVPRDKHPHLTDMEMGTQRQQSRFLSQSSLKMEPDLNPGRAAQGPVLSMPLKDAVGLSELPGLSDRTRSVSSIHHPEGPDLLNFL